MNLAARIVDLAGAGEVLVSEALLDAAGDVGAARHAPARRARPGVREGRARSGRALPRRTGAPPNRLRLTCLAGLTLDRVGRRGAASSR